MSGFKSVLLVCFMICSMASNAVAQSLLDRTISINVNKVPVSYVLKKMGEKGGFYFSYNSNIIKQDSLVVLSANNKTVQQILGMLFADRYVYTEKKSHIIIEKADNHIWYLSGYVVDDLTKEKIIDASVYDKEQLSATLTDEDGFFRLKLKGRPGPKTISISKAWYNDTAILLSPGTSQDITINIQPKSIALDAVVVTPRSSVEDTWLGRFFLSSRQRVQSLNIDKYFINMPYQASVLPGLSTHGRMGSQIVNKFSFNMLGGYTAGVNGFEIAGIFNIVKKDVQYAQVAGVFNIVGGGVRGLQVAGVYNCVFDTVTGNQVAGVSNFVKGSFTGAQIAGVNNHLTGALNGAQIAGVTNTVQQRVDGVQVAGVANVALKETNGTQVAGVANFSNRGIDGAQIAGVVNYAKRLDGVQVGLINIADTSSGYSIGLINVILKGYHKLVFSYNELTPMNVAIKMGNNKLYSILLGGIDLRPGNQALSFGYGMGKDISLGKHFSLNPEITMQHVYLGDWDHLNIINKYQLSFTWKINRYISIFAGPSYTLNYSEQSVPNADFKYSLPAKGYASQNIIGDLQGWVGGSAGISFF